MSEQSPFLQTRKIKLENKNIRLVIHWKYNFWSLIPIKLKTDIKKLLYRLRYFKSYLCIKFETLLQTLSVAIAVNLTSKFDQSKLVFCLVLLFNKWVNDLLLSFVMKGKQQFPIWRIKILFPNSSNYTINEFMDM